MNKTRLPELSEFGGRWLPGNHQGRCCELATLCSRADLSFCRKTVPPGAEPPGGFLRRLLFFERSQVVQHCCPGGFSFAFEPGDQAVNTYLVTRSRQFALGHQVFDLHVTVADL